ncbi:hypothetical protein LY78DRAFT_721599 [Colletotrichum sublineola]|nr:hypothetical protein LY78DRAFT_721599 [Colletotrichum sublineola]
MAEVVGILASVAALHAGISKADVERCANHLRTFSLAVRMAHETLREYSEDSSASSVFDFISSKQVLRAISIDSNSLKTCLSLAIKRFRNVSKDGLTPVAFIKWWLHKDAIITLFPEMERIKTSLTLIIVTIQLKLVFTNIEKASSNYLVIEKLVKKM